MEPLTRRRALAGAAVVGVGVPLLAACGGDDSSDAGGSDPASTPSDPTSSAPTERPSKAESGPESESPSPKAVDGLVATGKVPVGGGVILASPALVVTQPKAGTFRAFTSRCTHRGCTVNEVADGTIDCPCHGSKFSIEDGSVQDGPAPSPLSETRVQVRGGQVVKA